MRKEVLYAVIAGIVLGLIVAFGVYRINSVVISNATNKPQGTDNPTPTPTPAGPKEFKVVLDKPENNDVVTTNKITLSGLTKSGVWVVANSEKGDYFFKSDDSGAFSQDIDLTSGVNQIKLTAFDSAGNQTTESVIVVYSSSFVEKTAGDATQKANASDSSDIRQKVAADVANTINKPKAFIGTVTDITDSNIEIKTSKSDIEQIAIGPGVTSVLNIVGTNNKQVKTSDIAIGDFIVAMGYRSNNSVLAAQRILIMDALTDPKISVNIAKVTDTTKKTVDVATLKDGTARTLTPDSKTDIETLKDSTVVNAKLSSISADSTVIFITSVDDKNNTTVRSIFIVPQG